MDAWLTAELALLPLTLLQFYLVKFRLRRYDRLIRDYVPNWYPRYKFVERLPSLTVLIGANAALATYLSTSSPLGVMGARIWIAGLILGLIANSLLVWLDYLSGRPSYLTDLQAAQSDLKEHQR